MIKIKYILILVLFGVFLSSNSQTQSNDPAEFLQSFKPRGIPLPQFVKKCKDNNISLLLLTDRMGNKSKQTRFTTYKSELIYLSKRGQKKITYLFEFKDDTLMKVRSY